MQSVSRESEPRVSRTQRVKNWAEHHPWKATLAVTSAIMFPVGMGLAIYGSILAGIGITAGVIANGLLGGSMLEGITLLVTKAFQLDTDAGSRTTPARRTGAIK